MSKRESYTRRYIHRGQPVTVPKHLWPGWEKAADDGTGFVKRALENEPPPKPESK